MRVARVLAAVATTLALAGCEHATDAAACEEAANALLSTGSGSIHTAWRPAALAWTDSMDAAERVETVIRGITAADSGVVAPYGGSIVYNFHSFPAAGVTFPVAGLRTMASDPSADPAKKITGIEFGVGRMPACVH